MSFKGIAESTLKIVEEGCYVSEHGKTVSIREQVDRAVSGTVLYRPEEYSRLKIHAKFEQSLSGPQHFEVTEETTAEAGRRLALLQAVPKVAALNFASAKNPGGGFLGGAKAQEEDLARCSALYECLIAQPAYYEENRAHHSLLYTDHIIYSPDVPFFRDDRLRLLDQPYALSIITAPAPNAGAIARNEAGSLDQVERAFRRRAHMVLLIAAEQGHRVLVLGAWGCGVFRNDPGMVAAIFKELLASPPFDTIFERVVFAVYDNSPHQATLGAFRECFEQRS